MKAPSTLRCAAGLLLSAGLLGSPLLGCESTSNHPDAGTTVKGNVVLKDENNYASQSTLTISTVQTAPGADLDICWDGIAKDITGHALVPSTDIDNVSFLQIPNLAPTEIEAKLAGGLLTSSQIKIYRDFHVDHTTGATCTKLSTLSLGATPVAPATDYVEGSDKSYLILFSKGTTPGSGARSMVFAQPTAASTNTMLAAPDGYGILQFTADLTSPKPLPIPAAGPFVLDWSQITHDSMNNPVLFQSIDQVLIAFYEGMTVAYLQTNFFDIETLATSLYQVTIPQGVKYVDLAKAKDTTDAAFPGFARLDGVWAVGLLCSTCQVPAPVALSILAPM